MGKAGDGGGAQLPVAAVLPELLRAVETRRGAVLVAPTGSGKTSLVPASLLRAEGDSGRSVLLLEPRRVAARSAARWLARGLSSELGGLVGYAIRFERVAGPCTRLLVMTEGLLARRIAEDPFLENVGTVVIDEFHERSLHADLGLAMLRAVRDSVREDLRIVVMSATIDPGPVARFLDVPVVRSEGRSFPVERVYLDSPDDRPLPVQVAAAVRRLLPSSSGDFLVFLPGAGEIRRCAGALAGLAAETGLAVLPLHGDLPSADQDRVLAPSDRRRIILSTNVAESALTLEGVSAVIDSGWKREARYDPVVGADRLELRMISRASATQRAGRAGRTGPGAALHLWTKARDRELPRDDQPEIHRVDLSSALLGILHLGEDPWQFPWFERPSDGALRAAASLLERLGAVRDGRLTGRGVRLLRLPVPPRIGVLLIEGRRLGCLRDCSLAAAILSEREILLSARAFGDRREAGIEGDSDLEYRMDLLRRGAGSGRFDRDVDPRAARTVLDAAARLEAMAGGPEARSRSVRGSLGQALLAAFPERLSRRRSPRGGHGVMADGRGILLDPATMVKEAPLFLALSLHGGGGTRRGDPTASILHAVTEEQILEGMPGLIETREVATYDEASGRVAGRIETRFLDLLIRERDGVSVGPELAASILKSRIEAAPADWLPADPELASLLVRTACLRTWRPELLLPEFTGERLAGALVQLIPGCRSREDVRKRPLASFLLSMMTAEQRRAVENEVPECLLLPSGKRGRLRYEPGRPPVLSARVQDLFGLLETPSVAAGRVRCLIEILAPNDRPVQITSDLSSFWRNTYSRVRKDLRRRYPKHAWPERPPGF